MRAAVVISAGIAAAYAVLAWAVSGLEAAAPENTYGAYVQLALLYAVCAAVLALRKRWAVLTVAAVQVVVLALFVVFAVGLLGPGFFDDQLLRQLSPAAWAVGITAAQVGLLVVLLVAARQERSA